MRTILVLSLALALSACGGNAVEQAWYPIQVMPAAGDPERLVAVPPDCGPTPEVESIWSGSSWHNPQFGLGCSQARNLGAVIDDPRDLLVGRQLGPADVEREAAAVKRYREGKEKPLKVPATGYVSGGGEK